MISEAEELSQRVQDDLTKQQDRIQEEQEMDNPMMPGALWVEQYSPRRYTELLSDEVMKKIVLKIYKCRFIYFDRICTISIDQKF